MPLQMKNSLILTRAQSKEVVQLCMEKYHIPGLLLMENARRGIFEYLLSLNPVGKIIICCGKGNNGGDGLVVARHLDNQAIPVHVLLFSEPRELKGGAKINYDIVTQSKIPLTVMNKHNMHHLNHYLAQASWIIDALLGTGLVGELKLPYTEIINTMNGVAKKILSVDIPSGLDCDTGKPLGAAIHATATVTMVGFKLGFIHAHAKHYLGHVHIADIGAPRVLLDLILHSWKNS